MVQVLIQSNPELVTLDESNKFGVTKNNAWMLDMIWVCGDDSREILARHNQILNNGSLEELFKKVGCPVYADKEYKNFFSVSGEAFVAKYGLLTEVSMYDALTVHKLTVEMLEEVSEKGELKK